MGAPIATCGLPGRKLNCRTRSWFAGCCTKSWKSWAPCRISSVTHGARRMKKGLSEKSVPSLG
jgi:hypothetical protein